MSQRKLNTTLIKLTASFELKNKLQHLAESRGISLAAFIRLVLSEYVKNKG
jgi:predicted transcriptional regulator